MNVVTHFSTNRARLWLTSTDAPNDVTITPRQLPTPNYTRKVWLSGYTSPVPHCSQHVPAPLRFLGWLRLRLSGGQGLKQLMIWHWLKKCSHGKCPRQQVTWLLNATINQSMPIPSSVQYFRLSSKITIVSDDSGSGDRARFLTLRTHTYVIMLLIIYKNSSGDEIANVNFYAVRPGSYRNSLK